ncbi:MAG: hypothetical protein ACRCY8_15930 [Dermatophilaceae bacterium]
MDGCADDLKRAVAPLDGVDWGHVAVRAVDIGDERLMAAITSFLEVVSTATQAHSTALGALGLTVEQSVASWRDASERAADSYTEQQIGRPTAGVGYPGLKR